VLWESAKIARRTHAPQPLTIIHELVSAEYGHSSNHATVVLLLLARAWHGIAEYAVAHDIYTEIVAHFESNFGPSHVNTGVARLGLAHHFRHLDAGQLAVDEATKAVSIFINFYGNDHPNIGLALQERAATLVFNDTAQAMQIAQMSTALLEDTGASALAVASSKLVQVRCLVKLNRPQAAIALLREILDVTQREGGDTQVLCAETIDLESARRDLGLSDTEEFSEPNQVSIARILEMMADCHLHTSHFAQAKELYLEARRTYVRELGADCWDILSIDESLAEVLLYEGNRESAFAIYERLIARYRIDYGATSYHLAKVLEAAAQGCLREQYTEQAEAYAHAALEILEHNFGENGERLIGIYGLMGRLMAAKGDLSRATHFSEMAVTNARAFLPNGAYDLRVAIQDLRAIRPDWMVADSGEIFRGSV
jgi:tetratricopeptide (TPR) repeat protein